MNSAGTIVLCLFIALFTQLGCSKKPVDSQQAETKMDAPLRVKLSQAAADEPIQCIIKLSGNLDDKKRSRLSETGISIRTVVNNIVTIEGPPEAIRKTSMLDFVLSMAHSQTR